MMLCPCGGMSIPVWWNDTIPVWLLYLCGEQKNGVGCVPLELLHQFISLRQAFHGAIQSHDFVALSHTTHSVHVTYNTLSACHTQHTLCLSHTTHCLSHTTHSAPVTRNRLRVSARNVASLHAPVHIYSHTHPSPNTHTLPVVACTTNLHYSSGRLYSYTCPNLHYSSGRLQGSTCLNLHYSSGRFQGSTCLNLQFRQITRLYLS